MSGDYTRFTFKPRKDYTGVLKQQGRVDLDADFNECIEIVDRRWRSETIDIIGHCIVPITTYDAFLVTPTSMGDFDIGIGRMYVDGIQVENHGLPPLEFLADLGEMRGTQQVPYSDQPYLPAPLPEPLAATPGTHDLVYIDVWQREVTILEDPGLREIALGGPDTTNRVQSAWQVRVLQDVGPAGCDDTIAAWDDLVAPSAGRLTTSAVAPPASDDPCIVSLSGGYRGLENRLYRVEIHSIGPIGGGAPAKFKWSRNNASVASEVTAIPSTTRIAVREVGRDQVLRFEVGGWIEITDDYREFESQPGHMAQVTAIDEANRILTFAPAIPVTIDLDATDASRHTRVKRWDQTIGVDANGLLDVVAGPIDIEDGVQVEFSLDPAGGDFHALDYWVFAARTADGSVEVLNEAPPRGILHHYCRLGFINWGQNLDSTTFTDCRDHWPDCECGGGLCTVTVGDGVDSQGQFTDIQQAINSLGNRGGVVCIGRGFYLLTTGLILNDTKQNVILRGTGPATRILFVPQPIPGGPVGGGALLNIVRTSHIRIEDLYMVADRGDAVVQITESHFCRIERCTLVNAPPREPNVPPVRRAVQLIGSPSHIEVVNCELLAQKGVASTSGRVTELLVRDNRLLTSQLGVGMQIGRGIEILHNQFRGLPAGALAQGIVATRAGMDSYQDQVAALFQAAPATQTFGAAAIIILSGNRVVIDANLITAQVGVFGFLLFNARIHRNDMLCLIGVLNGFTIRFKFEDNFVFGLLAGVLHAGILVELDYTSNEFLGLNGIVWMSIQELMASFAPIVGGALGSVGFGTAGQTTVTTHLSAAQVEGGAVDGFGLLTIAKVHRNLFLTFTRGIFKTNPVLSADVSIVDNSFAICRLAGIELGGRGRNIGASLLALLVRIVTLRHLILGNSMVTQGPAVVSSTVFTELQGNTITCLAAGVELNASLSLVKNNEIVALPAELAPEGLVVLDRLCSNSVVTGNLVVNSRGHGILLRGDLTDIEVFDNRVWGALRTGIGTLNDVVFIRRAKIDRNTVEGCRGDLIAGSTAFSGAIVIAAGENIRVMSNVVRFNSPLAAGNQFLRWFAVYLEDINGAEVTDNRVLENANTAGLFVSGAVGLQGMAGPVRVQGNVITGNGGAALAIGEGRQIPDAVQQVVVENNQMTAGLNQNFQLVFMERLDRLIFSGNQCLRVLASIGLPAVDLLQITRGNICCNQIDTQDRIALSVSGAELVVNANTVRSTSTSSIFLTGVVTGGVPTRVIVTSNISNGMTINVGGPLVRLGNIPA